MNVYLTSWVDDKVNVKVAWHSCSMTHRASFDNLTDVESFKIFLEANDISSVHGAGLVNC